MNERSILWQAGQESNRTLTSADLPAPLADDDLLWLDLSSPTAAELADLGSRLGLDAHTVEDVLSPHERPKIVHLGGYGFMTAYTIHRAKGRVRLARLSAYLLDRILITIHPDEVDLDEVVARWRQDAHLVEWGVTGLLQGLLDLMVDQQFDILEALDTSADDLTRRLFADKPDVKTIQKKTFALRGELASLHRVIPQTRDIVAAILRQGLADEWTAELRTYWEDVNDHALRASEWTDSLRDLVTSIFEASLAVNDSRMNEVMKKLAAWAAIIAVPTLITGWFGMNVPYPGFSATAGLVTVVGLVLVSVVVLFVVFKKNDWL